MGFSTLCNFLKHFSTSLCYLMFSVGEKHFQSLKSTLLGIFGAVRLIKIFSIIGLAHVQKTMFFLALSVAPIGPFPIC